GAGRPGHANRLSWDFPDRLDLRRGLQRMLRTTASTDSDADADSNSYSDADCDGGADADSGADSDADSSADADQVRYDLLPQLDVLPAQAGFPTVRLDPDRRRQFEQPGQHPAQQGHDPPRAARRRRTAAETQSAIRRDSIEPGQRGRNRVAGGLQHILEPAELLGH